MLSFIAGENLSEAQLAAVELKIAEYRKRLFDVSWFWSGRAVIQGKRGSIPETLPPILDRLKINPPGYVKFIKWSDKNRFGNFIGPINAMRNIAERFGKSFLKGQTAAAQLFTPG